MDGQDDFGDFDPALALACGGCCAAFAALVLTVLIISGAVYLIRRDRPPPDA